jgi:ribA/ribD-fused uncharacterized protein
MDTSSFFIKDKAIFGCFPTQESVLELEEQGVRHFVDLTDSHESKIVPYITSYKYINYPIKDMYIPTDWKSYAKFIIDVCKIIKSLENNEKIYVHCKGGCGRSGVVVASILCHLFELSPEEALKYTTVYHSKRKTMKDRWRKIGSPQTYTQKKFIYKFFFPLKFYRTYKYSNTFGFTNYSQHTVHIEGIGTFPTAEAAFQAHKNLEDKSYIQNQLKSNSPTVSKYLGNKVKVRSDWEEIKLEIMENIVKLKFEQHEDIRENLLSSGLRPIVEHTKDDSFWGDGEDGEGKNMMGKILTNIRNSYYEKL